MIQVAKMRVNLFDPVKHAAANLLQNMHWLPIIRLMRRLHRLCPPISWQIETAKHSLPDQGNPWPTPTNPSNPH